MSRFSGRAAPGTSVAVRGACVEKLVCGPYAASDDRLDNLSKEIETDPGDRGSPGLEQSECGREVNDMGYALEVLPYAAPVLPDGSLPQPVEDALPCKLD